MCHEDKSLGTEIWGEVVYLLDKLAVKIGYKSYSDYLMSSYWKTFSRSVRGNVCFCCGSEGGLLVVHHRTYKRIGKELESDVVTVCSDCHEKIHYIVNSGECKLEYAHVFLRNKGIEGIALAPKMVWARSNKNAKPANKPISKPISKPIVSRVRVCTKCGSVIKGKSKRRVCWLCERESQKGRICVGCGQIARMGSNRCRRCKNRIDNLVVTKVELCVMGCGRYRYNGSSFCAKCGNLTLDSVNSVAPKFSRKQARKVSKGKHKTVGKTRVRRYCKRCGVPTNGRFGLCYKCIILARKSSEVATIGLNPNTAIAPKCLLCFRALGVDMVCVGCPGKRSK